MNVIFWLISAMLSSVWNSYRKKALNSSSLNKSLYILLWPFCGIFVVWTIIYLSDINTSIYTDLAIIWMIILIVLINIIANFVEMWVLKKTKLSEILPYTNLDKLFIVLIWFFLFYWTKNSTSYATLWITVVTIIVIAIFSIDFKNFKVPKSILKYSLVMLLRAISIITIWYIFIKYTTIEYLSVNIVISFWLYLLIAFIWKASFKNLVHQSKDFYIFRWLSLILARIWFIISLYIVKEAWLLIATLISFMSLVFNIIAMKIILKDSPQKKQILLAVIVTILIWIWFYLK